MKHRYAVAVVGSGFAGSLIAMIVKQLGHSVVLLEKGSHPRTVIGESSTPLSNLLLERLATRYNLPLLAPLTKWGSWQAAYPQIACGLKRGFTFFHGQEHLLVAASPNDTIADTHWYRADFDHLLVQQAQALGVDYVDQVSIFRATSSKAGWQLLATKDDQPLAFEADFVIDATGPRGFLHRALALGERELPGLPHTSALYTHFSGVQRSNPVTNAPYPVDDAAVHHLFDGGWVWVLRFNNGLTSAGVAATQSAVKRYGLDEGETGWTRLLASMPAVAAQFHSARAERPFSWIERLGFRSDRIVGDNWAMLPSAAVFVDPMLSTGFPLTLLGITRLAKILEDRWRERSLASSLKPALQRYAEQTDAETVAASTLVGALYANLNHFDTFRCLSLLYFAAASFSETAYRLDRPDLATGFLLHDHPVFGTGLSRIAQRAMQPLDGPERLELHEEAYALIDAFDVAGLGKRPVDHCYPVLAEDLYAAAHKVGASRAEIDTLLERAGFFAASTP